MRGLPFQVVDVFTDRPYAGNPLAVVRVDGPRGESDEPDAAAMQAIAREFALSETVFTLPPTAPGADYRVRIFTPTLELPFAGHPSVGAAWVLARDGAIRHGDVVQECGAGLLPVHVDAVGAQVTGGRPEIGEDLDPARLAAAVGLSVDDVDGAAAAGVAGAGVPFAILVVREGAVARAVADAQAVRAVTEGLTGLVVCSVAPSVSMVGSASVPPVGSASSTSGKAHLRMFAPGSGVEEDPATGSAAVALGAFLVDRGLLDPDGESAFTIAQGAEIGRPSRLDVTVRAEGGRAVSTAVRGAVVAISRGELTTLP